jgi:hypothetical protein
MQAERVDCPLIFRLPRIASGTHIEGFVVLEIAVTRTSQTMHQLDAAGTTLVVLEIAVTRTSQGRLSTS